MSRAEEFEALRKEGMTYRQIAERCGCSYQNVAKYLAKRDESKFRAYTPQECKYDGLRNWMNENKIHRVDLAEILFGTRMIETWRRGPMRSRLTGETDFKQGEIENLINASGLTYEQLFHGGDKLVRCHECIHKMKRDLFNHTVYECCQTELQITNMNGFCDKGKRA